MHKTASGTFIGFNQENTAYTYDEISKKYNIKNIQVLSRIVFHNLYIVISDIDNVLKRVKNEKRPNLSILIGKLFQDEKIVQCFVIRHIYTLGDLLYLSTDDIHQIRGLGSSKAKEIINVVHSYGFKLRNENNIFLKNREENREENINNFKRVLHERYFKNRVLNNVSQKKYSLGFEFLINELLSEDKKCIISLTVDETYIIRSLFGFNTSNHSYTYLEISKITKIKDIPVIISQIMTKFTMIIDDIYDFKQVEFQNVYPLNILVGELNLSSKINNILFQNKIYTLADLMKYKESGLLKISKLGEKSVLEIINILSNYGIDLKEKICEIKKDETNFIDNEKETMWQLRALVNSYQKVTSEINELNSRKEDIENKIKELIKDKDISELEFLNEKAK